MKKTLYILVLFFLLNTSAFAFVGNPWMVDASSNPAKLFFSGNSVFVGELSFKDSALESNNPNPVMQNPSFNMNVSILGNIAGLNMGFTTTMEPSETRGHYTSYMERYIDIMFAYGYKYFSVGLNLYLEDMRYRQAVFNNAIPFLSFFGESLFGSYVDIPGSVNTNLGLSLIFTDGEYFGIGVFAPKFFLFNSSRSVFDAEELYKSLNFGLSGRSPRYDKNDDLLPVVATLNIDALRILGDNKTVSANVDLSLILSPDMYVSLRNILDFYFYYGERFSLSNDRYFLHTLSLFFDITRFSGEIGFKLPPSVYQGSSRRFEFFFNFRFVL